MHRPIGLTLPRCPRTPSALAMVVHAARTLTAGLILAEWASHGWTHVVLDGAYAACRPGRPPARLAPALSRHRGGRIWPIVSDAALDILVATLALGAVYDEAADPCAAGPDFELRALAYARSLLDAAGRP